MTDTATVDPDAGVRDDARGWFLDWLEDGQKVNDAPTGKRRSWGELAVTSHGTGYDVRHESDTGVPAESLEGYEDPIEARGISKFDDEGGYRPMRGETTLPTGWVFPSLDAEGMTEVLGKVYPASVENRYLEANDALDPTHWDETSGRQTGIYSNVEKLTGEPLRCATEAFCASRCVKRREWEASEDEDIDSETEGDFPCREACSLFVVGAREFVNQEKGKSEEEKAALETPTEQEPRRGELGDPANEYRKRYTASRLGRNDVR
jgi:sirohydrochlorin cobaltochelatase